MEKRGWKYQKLGGCADCSEASSRLYVPVLSGSPVECNDSTLVGGVHIPHFNPVCRSCSKKYNLEEICKEHNLPVLVNSKLCRLCMPKHSRLFYGR